LNLNLLVKKITKTLLVLTIFTSSFLPTAVSASTCTCVCGTGSISDPWIIDSDAALACFDAGSTYIAPGTTAYMKQTADVSYHSNLRVYQEVKKLDYEGGGYSITIDNVANFQGLFISSSLNPVTDYQFHDLKIKVAGATTLDNNSGWLVSYAENSTFERIIVEGDISQGSGGIVGVGDNVTITYSYSSGSIGTSGGGLLGANSTFSTIHKSYSTGAISTNAGGLVGANSTNIVVTNSYTTGNINGGGGIFGNLVGISSGSNLYTSGSAVGNTGGILKGSSLDRPTGVTNSYAEAHNFGFGFNKANALTVLVDVGPFDGTNVWGECDAVFTDRYYLQIFYTSDPCAPGGGGGGSGTDEDPYEVTGTYSITCPEENPWKNEEINYANKVKPLTKENENLVGKFIPQTTLKNLSNKGIIFDHWSNQVKTATIELTNYGCTDKLVYLTKNKPIQFISGGLHLQSEARGYLRTPDGSWFDLTGVTLSQNTAAFIHPITFTKPGKYLIVISEAPNTEAGLIPTYGYKNARFLLIIDSNKAIKSASTIAKTANKILKIKPNSYKANKIFQPLSY